MERTISKSVLYPGALDALIQDFLEYSKYQRHGYHYCLGNHMLIHRAIYLFSARVSSAYNWIRNQVCANSIKPPASFQCGNIKNNPWSLVWDFVLLHWMLIGNRLALSSFYLCNEAEIGTLSRLLDVHQSIISAVVGSIWVLRPVDVITIGLLSHRMIDI